MPQKPDPIPTDGWSCPRCRERFSAPEAAADHLAAAVDKAQADVKRLGTVLVGLERTTACYCEPGTGIPRVPPHTTACREAVVAMRDITGFGTWALYRAGVYKEPYPNQARTVIRPTGDPLFLMYHPYEDNVPLCHCGGTIIQTEGEGDGRVCTDCRTPYVVSLIESSHYGRSGYWQGPRTDSHPGPRRS